MAATSPQTTRTDHRARLEQGCTELEAGEILDALPPVGEEEMLGRWRGAEVKTGHPLNGLLDRYGWYGKEFIDAENVHPLLFQNASGAIYAVDPRLVPLAVAEHLPRAGFMRNVMSFARPLVGTTKPRARLRSVKLHGKVSAAMVYDDLPIIDVFRRVDDEMLLGVMDRRGDPRPFYFTLRRTT